MDKMELVETKKQERLEMSQSGKRTIHPFSGFSIADVLQKDVTTPEERALRMARFKKLREQRRLEKMVD